MACVVKKIGHWPGESEMQIKLLLKKFDIPIGSATDGAANLIEYTDTSYGLLKGDTDCVIAMSYNEYKKISDGGFHKNELSEFRFDNLGLAMLEDGLWVLEERLNDDKFQDAMVRFVRASMKGWRWAEENQEEAVQIVLQVMGGVANEEHQTYMLAEIAKLTAGSNGALELDDYNRTVEIAMDTGIISKPPQGAWTSDITDNARIYGTDRFDRLLVSIQDWATHFLLTLLDPRSTLAHICWALLVASMFMRNMVTLRILVIASSFVAIANDMFLRFDYATMFWTILLILPNLWYLLSDKILGGLVKFTPEEDEMYAARLAALSRMKFRKIIGKGRWETAEKGMELAIQGQRISNLYFLSSMSCTISHDNEFVGKLSAPNFYGAHSIVYSVPASFSVEADEGAHYWTISVEGLRDLMRDPAIHEVLMQVFYEDTNRFLRAILRVQLESMNTVST